MNLKCNICHRQSWCICHLISQIYNKSVFNNKQCICFYERSRVIKQFQHIVKPTSRKKINASFSKIHRALLNNNK